MIPLITMVHVAGHPGHLNTPMIKSPAASAVRNSQDSQTPPTKPNVTIASKSPPAISLSWGPSCTRATTRMIATNAA
jgi:hypothetical protein